MFPLAKTNIRTRSFPVKWMKPQMSLLLAATCTQVKLRAEGCNRFNNEGGRKTPSVESQSHSQVKGRNLPTQSEKKRIVLLLPSQRESMMPF